MRTAFPDPDLRWALQAEQLGTGHALMQALPAIPDDHRVLVLFGDVPLLRPATLASLLGRAADDALVLLSVLLDDPTGYGRVLRDNAGSVYRIVEQKDANRKELAVREANTGVLVAPAAALRANSRSATASPVVWSRLPVGSSANSSKGAGASARAIATRCCSPPDSCAG